MANKNIRSLSFRKELDDNLFENIADLSHKNAPKSAFQKLAKRFMIDDSVVVGTASFYDFTRGENRNKKIHVCNGTACMVAKTQSNLHKNLEKHFKKDEIGHTACVGRCHSNNAFLFDNKTGYYLVGANDPQYRKDGTGGYVVFEQIRYCIEKGLSYVDFMGINSPFRGDFKTSFNADPKSYYKFTLG